MYNFRKVDDIFYLSGGWSGHFEHDLGTLLTAKVRMVLDLGFTPIDVVENQVHFYREQLNAVGIQYANRAVWDGNVGQDMEEFWKDTNKVLASFQELSPPNSKILIKCAGGMSRSPAALIAYFCETKDLTFEQAYAYLDESNARAEAKVNLSPFFQHELKRIYGSEFDGYKTAGH